MSDKGQTPEPMPGEELPEQAKVKQASKAVAAKPAPIDFEAPLLTDEEIEAIKIEARTSILKEKKAAARKNILEREKDEIRYVDGLKTGSSIKDEMVSITIDLANYAPSIVINMRPYWHGQTYTVQRHIADTIRDMMYRTWGHQNEVDGKSRTDFYAKKRLAELYTNPTLGARI